MEKRLLFINHREEEIVKEYLNGESATKLTKEYNLSNKIIYRWLYKYNQFGIEGLKSNTGKHKNLNAGLHLRKQKSKIEELELEILKKDIEIARLKKENLEKIADGNENITFLGRQSDDIVKKYMSECKALLYPGEEDFGIVPVEAQACGRPVIAYGKGGVLDSVVDGKTGV